MNKSAYKRKKRKDRQNQITAVTSKDLSFRSRKRAQNIQKNENIEECLRYNIGTLRVDPLMRQMETFTLQKNKRLKK